MSSIRITRTRHSYCNMIRDTPYISVRCTPRDKAKDGHAPTHGLINEPTKRHILTSPLSQNGKDKRLWRMYHPTEPTDLSSTNESITRDT